MHERILISLAEAIDIQHDDEVILFMVPRWGTTSGVIEEFGHGRWATPHPFKKE